MGLTRPIPFFSVNPACSLWFPITSHAGKDRTNLSFLKDNKKKLSQELGSQHRSSTIYLAKLLLDRKSDFPALPPTYRW